MKKNPKQHLRPLIFYPTRSQFRRLDTTLDTLHTAGEDAPPPLLLMKQLPVLLIIIIDQCQ